MRIPSPPNLVDWLAVSLRWVILLGLALSFSDQTPYYNFLVVVIISFGLWNLYLTGMAAIDRKIRGHEHLSFFIDLLVASITFYFSGAFAGNITWVGLLPLLTSVVYFPIKGILLVIVLTILIQGVLGTFYQDILTTLLMLGWILPLYLVVGLAVGYSINLLKAKVAQAQNQQEASRHTERERRRSIYQLISALNSTLNYERVLDSALDLGAHALSSSDKVEGRLVSAVMLYSKDHTNGHELRVGSARRFTSADLRIGLPGTTGLLRRVIERGEASLLPGPEKDPELGRIISLRTCQSLYCIPLRSGLETYGVMLFGHPDKNFFNTDQREVLDVIGSQAVTAIQNARLYRDLELEKERMMEIQDEARKKLARDLHDGPTQSVSALAMRANFARRLIEKDQSAAAEELFKIEELARRTTKEIRHMLFTLRPLVLESQGLIPALESMAEKMRETFNQNVLIEADPKMIPELEMGRQAVIFYIAEEAVNNARKHAQAVNIWVRLKPVKGEIVLLEIEDDGTGFDTNIIQANYEQRGSLGMINMRERTELVNGVLQIESNVGRGTRIRVWIPLTDEAAERLRRGK